MALHKGYRQEVSSIKEEFNKRKNINCNKQPNINSKLISLGVIFSAYIVWLRDLVTKKIGAQMFGEIPNVVQEEIEEDKNVRESK